MTLQHVEQHLLSHQLNKLIMKLLKMMEILISKKKEYY